MNVYDFDGTIYDGDSTLDFYRFMAKRKPALLRYLPLQLLGVLGYMAGIGTKEHMKEWFYSFLRGISDMDEQVSAFWAAHEEKIKPWYLKQKRRDDIIISASPVFLLQPVCDRLKVRLLASEVDPHTGRYRGLNCKGTEKVRRYHEVYGNDGVDAFYSDSDSDVPMARLAGQAFKVKGNRLAPWRLS